MKYAVESILTRDRTFICDESIHRSGYESSSIGSGCWMFNGSLESAVLATQPGLTVWENLHTIPPSRNAEVLASLAKAIPTKPAIGEQFRWIWSGNQYSDKLLTFAHKVRYKEGSKPRFYSVDLMKVSSAKQAMYDRRFSPITQNHNGSLRSMGDILNASWSAGIVKIHKMAMIRDWCMRNTRSEIKPLGELLGWATSSTEIEAFDFAWNAFCSHMELFVRSQQINNLLEGFKHMALQNGLEQ